MSDIPEDKPPRKKPGTPKGYKQDPKNIRPYYADEKFPPEKKGAKKRGPLDWSLDELIKYKADGGQPMRIPDKDILFQLGRMGISMVNVAELFKIGTDKFCKNEDWIANWQAGKAECVARVRQSIVEDALEKDILNAKLYLDKIWATDKVAEEVTVNVRNSELSEIDTTNLLEVMYKTLDPDGNKE